MTIDGKQVTQERERLFVEAYISNGHDQSKAALAAGYAATSARVRGCQLMRRPSVKAALDARANAVAAVAEMTTARWARDLTAITHLDPGELYDEAGNLIAIHKLPEHVRRAIASVEVIDGRTKVKFADKNRALETMGKHLGLFERDNSQKRDDVRVQVVLVG